VLGPAGPVDRALHFTVGDVRAKAGNARPVSQDVLGCVADMIELGGAGI
jgi:hypothetical protein